MAIDDPILPVFAGIYRWSYPIDLDQDGRDFRVTMYANAVEPSWWLDLYDVNGTPLICGLKLRCGEHLLEAYQDDPRFPRGVLSVVCTDGTDLDPGPDDLGIRVLVTYVPGAPP